MSKVEANEYTESAKRDVIYNFLKDNKEHSNTLYKFTGRPSGTFLFNPMDQDLIFDWFLEDAEQIITQIKIACIQLICGWGGERLRDSLVKNFTVQISDSNKIKMHDWDASYEGIPVAVNCQVIAAMTEETYTKSCTVYCPECKHVKEIFNLNTIPRCVTDSCPLKGTLMTIRRETLKTGPIRTVLIQEPLEEAKFGMPRILPCVLRDDDVKNTFAGRRKKIIGIFRSEPQKFKSTNTIKIHAISTHDLDYIKPIMPTPEQRKQFERMTEDSKYIPILQSSFAPEIKLGGSELAKLTLILSILGGNKTGRLRGLIHALLIGNPSTAKSKMLEFITFVDQISGFAVGGTASGAGITVTMDTLPNRIKIARTGLIPNCTGGSAAIDEMNQLEPEDLGKMFEVMESMRIHYEKGGIKMDAIAETSIQGGANPKGYYYDSTKSIIENINLPGPLIQRFDLKTNLLDNESREEERNIRKHINLIRSIGVEKYVENNNLLTPQEELVLFNHAKTFKPIMTSKAEETIEDFISAFTLIKQKEGSLIFDRRTSEALGRVATAYAKLHFSKTVEPEHAMTTVEIFKKTFRTFNMNVEAKEAPALEERQKTKDEAFDSIFKQLQQIHDVTFLDKITVLQAMTRTYPKFWNTPTAAEKFFDSQKHNMTKRGNKYNLE